MKSPPPQLEKPAANSPLIRLGRIGVAVLLVVAVYQTISGWRHLFTPAPTAVRHDLATADRWDRLPSTLSGPGNWSVLGSAWRAELQKTLPNQAVNDVLQVRVIPAELPPATTEERELIELLTQITSPVATEHEGILCRKSRFTWGQITAATARVDGTERLLEVVVNVGDKSGGYCIRVRPHDAKVAASEESLGVVMPTGALCMGTKFDEANHAVCEVWMTSESLQACEQAWKAAGWALEASPSSKQAASCMLSRESETICALLPSGESAKGRRNMILLVRLSDAPSAAVADR